MKITPFFRVEDIHNQIIFPYNEVLELLCTLSIAPPKGKGKLDYNEEQLCGFLNCTKNICDILVKESCAFPACLNNIDKEISKRSLLSTINESEFTQNLTYQRTILWGCVYYVLARCGCILKHRLSLVEKLASEHQGTYSFFEYFNDALEGKKLSSEAMLIIDEVECSYHPEAQRRIYESYLMTHPEEKQPIIQVNHNILMTGDHATYNENNDKNK